jgi:antitoxin MazE
MKWLLRPIRPYVCQVEEGRLIIMPLAESKPALADLLAQITAENLHDEIDTGTVVGNEVW